MTTPPAAALSRRTSAMIATHRISLHCVVQADGTLRVFSSAREAKDLRDACGLGPDAVIRIDGVVQP